MYRPTLFSNCFAVLCLFFISNTYGEGLKFGKIPDDLVAMKEYKPDLEAEAVVLSHTGEAKFEYKEDKGYIIVYKIHKVVKILKKTGLDHAEFTIPYYTFLCTIDDIATLRGHVYNMESGKVVKEKLEKEHIFDEKVSSSYHLRKVAMPNVKEGSVIEIYYEITSNLHHYFREWEFQSSIPTKWSEYLVEFPQYFNYSQTNQGAHPYAISSVKSGHYTTTTVKTTRSDASLTGGPSSAKFTTQNINFPTTIYHWVAKDAPALRMEAYIDNPMSYATKVEFQLQSVQFPNSVPRIFAKGWGSMSEELLKDEDFGKHLGKAKFAKDLVPSIVADASTDIEKVAKIFDHVSSKIKWNGKRGIYPSKALEKVYQEGSGNLADVNFILTIFLREAGFDANPVVSISRDRGFINPSNPVMYKLNVLTSCVRVNDKDIILDASDNLLPFGFLNRNYINIQGWMVAPGDAARWVAIQNYAINSDVSITKLKIEDNKIRGEVSNSSLGYNGVAIRNAIVRDGEEKYKSNVEVRWNDWEISNVSLEKVDNRHTNVVEKYEMMAKEEVEGSGGMIYLQPLEHQVFSENPFKTEKRIFPIDFVYPQKSQLMWTLQIPEGYMVEELPKSVVAHLPDKAITYTFNIGAVGNNIQLMCSYQVNKTLFNAEEYANVREFFDMVAKKQSEVIVLKKN